MAVEPIHPLAFTIHDAVAYSGLSRSRLYTLIQTGELPSLQVGGRRMIRRDALDAFFAKLAEAA
ncbi:helix-turn-helix domain-containing protein [Brevundimonas sp.]|uniref:helix-turn-helix domain-containing protein n=1 Tax=Brevundimonas sp. TaxID=1871086 RepID=UPI00391CFEFE